MAAYRGSTIRYTKPPTASVPQTGAVFLRTRISVGDAAAAVIAAIDQHIADAGFAQADSVDQQL